MTALLKRPYTIASTIILTAMVCVLNLRTHQGEWETIFLAGGKMLRGGEDFYKNLFGFTYPPFTALLMVPFTFVPSHLGRVVWCGASVLSLAYLVVTAWRLAAGPTLEPPEKVGWREHFAFFAGLICAFQFALNALTHLQSDLFIAALLMAGCQSIQTRRFILASLWIGVAAAFKATPLLFAPYLAWRKQWFPAATVFIVAIGLNLLPNLVHQPPNGGLWLGEWYAQYLKPMTSSTYKPGDWKNVLNDNQSLAGAADRWLTTTWIDQPGNFQVVDRPGHVATPVVRAFLAACFLLVLIPSASAMWRSRRYSTIERHPPFPDPRMIECGIILLLMLLLSPNSSRAHFCMLFLPAFCVSRFAFRPGAPISIRLLLIAAALCSTLSIHIRLPGTQADEQVLLWLAVVTFLTIFLLWASILMLWHWPPRSA